IRRPPEISDAGAMVIGHLSWRTAHLGHSVNLIFAGSVTHISDRLAIVRPIRESRAAASFVDREIARFAVLGGNRKDMSARLGDHAYATWREREGADHGAKLS